MTHNLNEKLFEKRNDFLYFNFQHVIAEMENMIELAQRLSGDGTVLIYQNDLFHRAEKKGELSDAVIRMALADNLGGNYIWLCFYYNLFTVDACPGCIVIRNIDEFIKMKNYEDKESSIQAIAVVSLNNIKLAHESRQRELQEREDARQRVLAKLTSEEKQLLGVH